MILATDLDGLVHGTVGDQLCITAENGNSLLVGGLKQIEDGITVRFSAGANGLAVCVETLGVLEDLSSRLITGGLGARVKEGIDDGGDDNLER